MHSHSTAGSKSRTSRKSRLAERRKGFEAIADLSAAPGWPAIALEIVAGDVPVFAATSARRVACSWLTGGLEIAIL